MSCLVRFLMHGCVRKSAPCCDFLDVTRARSCKPEMDGMSLGTDLGRYTRCGKGPETGSARDA